jgi:hypothetical protein
MRTEQQLSRAAECLFMAVESPDADKQTAMLNMAQFWLEQSEQIRNSVQHPLNSEGAPGTVAAVSKPAKVRPRRSDRARAVVKRAPNSRGRARKSRPC